MAGVPLLYIAFNSINLEPPSETSRSKAESKMHEMLIPSAHERVALNELKKVSLDDEDSKKKKRKHKIRGPNPLSCKKKQKSLAVAHIDSPEKKKRKRKRVRKTISISTELSSTV